MHRHRHLQSAAIAAASLLLLIGAVSFAGSPGGTDAGQVTTARPGPTTPTTVAQGHSDQHLTATNHRTTARVLFTAVVNRDRWYAEAARREAAAEEAARAQAVAAAERSAQRTRTRPAEQQSAPSSSVGSGRCGGDLPPCYVVDRESRGQVDVYNTEGSGASGKYQFMPGTWNGYGGYANAADAPESVQDEKAREVWAGGAGCSHWSAC